MDSCRRGEAVQRPRPRGVGHARSQERRVLQRELRHFGRARRRRHHVSRLYCLSPHFSLGIDSVVAMTVYSLLNPVFLFVLICLAGFWFYVSSAAANETPEQPMKLFGRPVSPDQRKIGMIAGTLTRSLRYIRSAGDGARCSRITCFCGYSEPGGYCHLWRLDPLHHLLGQVRVTVEILSRHPRVLTCCLVSSSRAARRSRSRTPSSVTARRFATRTSWGSCRPKLIRSPTRSNTATARRLVAYASSGWTLGGRLSLYRSHFLFTSLPSIQVVVPSISLTPACQP